MAIAKLKPGYAKLPAMSEGVPNIFEAAENNDVPALERALTFYDVNARDESGMTPLHYAASTQAYSAIQRLLAHPNIDATIADQFGRSAATVAYECWAEYANQTIALLKPHCYPWLYKAHD